MRRDAEEVLQRRGRSADDPPMRCVPGRTGRPSQRGATLVEYSLIIAVFVFGSLGAIAQLDSQSGEYYGTASNDIGELPQSNIDTSDDGTVPPFVPTSSTTPPTTVATTTTTLLRSTVSELTDISTSISGSSNWNARVRAKIVRTDNGNAVDGATVYIRLTGATGNYVELNCQTGSTGRCQVSATASWQASPVTAEVYWVSSSPRWDGNRSSTLLYKP